MKRLSTVLLLVLVLTSLAVVMPVSASHLWVIIEANCNADSGTITYTAVYDNDGTNEAGVTFSVTIDGVLVDQQEAFVDGDQIPEGAYSLTTTSGLAVEGARVVISTGEDSISTICGEGSGGGPCPNVMDGRLNNDPGFDCAAPVAVYQSGGTIRVFAVNPGTGAGTLTLRIPAADVTALGVPTGSNALLAEASNPFTGQHIGVYRLTSGEFQLNTWYADGK